MFSGNIYLIIKIILAVALTAALFAWLGWWLRCKLNKCGATTAELEQERQRANEYKDKLKQAESATKTCQTDLAALTAASVSRKDLEAAQKALADEQASAQTLQSELRKTREALSEANARTSEADKGAKKRMFEIENELSKAREEAGRLRQEIGTKTAGRGELEAEIARLKQSLSSATNTFGQAQRERDAAKAELERFRAKTEAAAAKAAASATAASPGSASGATAAAVTGPIFISRAEPKPVVKTPESKPVVKTPEPEPTPAAPELPAGLVLGFAPTPELSTEPAPAEAVEAPSAEPEKTVEEESPAIIAAGTKLTEATDILGKRVAQDDLKIVEGIGPKIEALFKHNGIATWKALAAATPGELKAILEQGGERFTFHDPTTWPKQAELADAAKWTELRAWQDQLDGGKAVE